MPDEVMSIHVNPVSFATVAGPSSDTNIFSLDIGATDTGVATLALQPSVTLTVLNQTAISSRGALAGSGHFDSRGGLVNDGDIELDGMTISAPTIENNGVISGGGTIDAQLMNSSSGEVRVAAGQQIHLSDTGSQSNAGRINVIGNATQAAEIEFDGELTNAVSTGNINASYAIIRVNGGLANQGAVNISFGTSNVHGDIDNQPTGVISVKGNSNVTFWDDMTNNGTVEVASGSTAAHFGTLSGEGSFTGGGTNFVEGGLSPGSSPGTMSFDGDVVLGTTSTTQIELGETSDQLLVDGNASLDGELNVELLGDFTPDHGDQFPVITAGTRDGEFETIDGIQVAADLTLAPIYDYAGHIGLMLIAAAPGDANFDGIVDVADLGILGANFNAADMQWNTGDFNLDNMTDVADLGILGANWSASQSTGNASALVPEPTTLLLLAVSVLMVGRRRRG